MQRHGKDPLPWNDISTTGGKGHHINEPREGWKGFDADLSIRRRSISRESVIMVSFDASFRAF
jgi:hypothetical protein